MLASEELRRRSRRHGQQFNLSAAKLAEFITSVEAEEVLRDQRRHDEEARAVLSLMEGTIKDLYKGEAAEPRQEQTAVSDASALREAAPVLETQRGDDIYEDYEGRYKYDRLRSGSRQLSASAAGTADLRPAQLF